MFVFGEQIVEDPEGGLQIVVDYVFRSGLGLGKAGILH